MNYNSYTFFFKGPFSQWFPSQFVVDGVKYNCSEQYMMAEKARLFKDESALRKILASSNPREQKAYGKAVKNFNKEEWETIAKKVVKDGNYAKFSQNQDLKKLLLDTKGTLLVEASPYDKIWGIGLAEDNKDIYDRRKWKGRNWLGQVLTEVRDSLLEEGE